MKGKVNVLRRRAATVAAGGVLMAATAGAVGQEVTGKDNLICATQDVMACVEDARCVRGSAKTFDVPAFMFIDFDRKRLRGVDEDGSEVVSSVKGSDVTEKAVIMQGFENHTGWTVAIDKSDGTFTLNLTSADLNFMMMGACTTL